jgi:tRNA/tmRNA/rRNA uracil-C5-methylase (TrmA/RlmC/RlmD family)
MSIISQVWFEQAKKLSVDEAIFLRVADKSEQNELANALEKEREVFASIDPVHASQIFINKTLKNMKQYVVIERKYRSPYTAFFKNSTGVMSKLTIDPERQRQLMLMLKDKKTRGEIEEALNGLTDEEIEEFFS